MSSKLGLRYAPHLNAQVMTNLELAGRQCGLPLGQLELLGQDETTALDFIASLVAKRARQFLALVDWDHLEGLYQNHRATTPVLTN